MFSYFWANYQLEPFYTTATLILTDDNTGVAYRFEKAWRQAPDGVTLSNIAQQQIDDLELELSAMVEIEDAIIYENGLEG